MLLQNDIQKLVDDGYTFDGTVLNIATQTPVNFLTKANSGAKGPTVSVSLPQFGGGIENIQFLVGQTVKVGSTSVPEENAQTALVYATFWIETVTNKKTDHTFTQLQYAQTVILNFPIFLLLNPAPPAPPTFVNLGWPHITVATLRKTFG